MSQIEEDIKGSMFVRVHNSYLVNLEKLREVERESVPLRSGLKVPITRTYKQEFNKAYISWEDLLSDENNVKVLIEPRLTSRGYPLDEDGNVIGAQE